MGAWIETANEKNLKLAREVAPHMGAWIETHLNIIINMDYQGRTPYGCVD